MRTILASSLVVLIIAACDGPLATVSPAPTDPPSPPTTVAPATASPTAVPTIEPTPTAVATATETGSGETVLFNDDFDDPGASSWETFELEKGSVSYDLGGLLISFNESGSIWSDRLLDAHWNALRIDGYVSLGIGSGSAGWMCGSSASDHVGGLVTSENRWVLAETSTNRSTELDGGPLPVGDEDDIFQLTVECAGTATGALRVRLLVDGQEFGRFERVTGPVDFDRVVAFASSFGEFGVFSALFDRVAVTGATDFAGFSEARSR